MMENIHNKILHAVRDAWALDGSSVFVFDINYDWVVTKKTDAGSAGGLRLVVPKNEGDWFLIPSYCAADNENGVSYEYDIMIKIFDANSLVVVNIIKKYIEINALKLLKNLKKSGDIGVHYIDLPLKLIGDLAKVNCSVILNRVDNKGGYY